MRFGCLGLAYVANGRGEIHIRAIDFTYMLLLISNGDRSLLLGACSRQLVGAMEGSRDEARRHPRSYQSRSTTPTIAWECLGGHEHGQMLEIRAAESGKQAGSKVQGQ